MSFFTSKIHVYKIKKNKKSTNRLISFFVLISILLSISSMGVYPISANVDNPDFEVPDVFDGDTPLTPAPTWEQFTDASGPYQFAEKKYVSLDEYVSKYGTSEKYDELTTIIRIDNAAQLHKFSQLTNDLNLEKRKHFLARNYVLGNNIDYASYADNNNDKYFIPVGRGEENSSGDIPFTGVFDGQGFDISNLYYATDIQTVSQHQYFAFFSANSGTVKNFGLISPVIDTRSNIGNIYASGIVGKNKSGGVVEYVFVDDTASAAGYLCSVARVAGLVNINEAGAVVSNAYYSGVVTNSSDVVHKRPLVGVNNGTIEKLFYNSTKYIIFGSDAPDGTETGTVSAITETNLYSKNGCLTDSKWRKHEYSLINISSFSNYMKAMPRLYGFTALTGTPNNNWGTANYPIIILTPADLVYFPKFIASTSTPNTTLIGKRYHIGACIDMSSVSEDAYFFPNLPSLATAGTIDGLRDQANDPAESGWCEKYHNHFGENHAIVNLKMVKTVTGTVSTYTDAKLLGFYPYASQAATIRDITFIGGFAKPQIAQTDLAGYHFIGSVYGYSSSKLQNIHSSMSVIIPDSNGYAPYFSVGGLCGANASPVTYSSFSGFVSGGVHKYNELKPPSANYNVGGLFGQIIGSAAACTVLLNTAKVEGCGFYSVPSNIPEFTDSHGTICGTTAGGLAGGKVVFGNQNPPAVNICFTNKGDLYSVPMDKSGTAPRKGPANEPVYACNAAIGGIYASGLHMSITIKGYSKNFGNIYAHNLFGTSGVSGGLGYTYRVSHGESARWVVNYGDIFVRNSSGKLSVSGITSRPFASSCAIGFFECYNFGDIDVDQSNKLSLCAAGGLGAQELDGGTSAPSENSSNYGNITLDIRSSDCDTVAAGVMATQGISVAPSTFTKVKNFGDITVKTIQNSGVLKVSGIGPSNMDRCVNKGNIKVNATGNLTGDIYIGGINSTLQTAKNFSSVINSGNIDVSAKTSGVIYAGGAYGYTLTGATSVKTSCNFGTINIENTGSGGAVAGGLAGYFTGTVLPEISDSVNSGNVSVKTAGSSNSLLLTSVGGIAGMLKSNAGTGATTSIMLRNNINYGNISSATTNTDANIYQYTGGTAGYLGMSVVNGLVNHGRVTANTATANPQNTATGGIIGYYATHNLNIGVTNLINYGDITQSIGACKGAILGYTAFMASGNYTPTAIPWSNHVNTSNSASMYGGTNGIINDTNYKKFVWKNIATTNPADAYLTGTANYSVPFYGLAKLYTNDAQEESGIYASDFFLNTDIDANSCLIYDEDADLAGARMSDFPLGMYALTAVNSFDIELYLPITSLVGLDGLPITNGTTSETTWRTDNKKDAAGNPIPNTSIEHMYDFVMQVDRSPKILAMSLFSEKPTDDIAHTIGAIQRIDDQNKILYFYSTENLLGREYMINTYTTSDGTLASSPDGSPISDIVLRAGVDGDEADVYIIKPGDDAFEPVKYTIKLVHLPNPQIDLVSIFATTAKNGTVSSSPSEIIIDNSNPAYPVYEIKNPVYVTSTSNSPFFNFHITTKNLENNFSLYHHTTVTRDDNGEDYSNWIKGATASSGFWQSMYSKAGNEYVSSNNTHDTPATVKANTNIYSALGANVPPGKYTMKVIVNGRVLLAIRFDKASDNIPQPNQDEHYEVTLKETAEESFITRTDLIFGATRSGRSYPFSPPDTDARNEWVLTPKGNTVIEKNLLIKAELNDDGTHTYTNKLKLTADGTVWWWTLYTTEEKTMTAEVTDMRLNDISLGNINTVTVSNEMKANEIKFSNNLTKIDINDANCFESEVIYNDGTGNYKLTLKPGTKGTNPTYQLDGVDILKVSQARISLSVGRNEVSGRYDYTINLSEEAPAGEYKVYPVYKRSQSISLSTWNSDGTFAENDHTETLSWHHKFSTPITIKKPPSSDSYIKSVSFARSLLETIKCTTEGHDHGANPAYVANGRIHYSTLPLTGENRCKNFEYLIYLPEEDVDLSNYNTNMKLPVGGTLYISDGDSGWIPVPAQHTADYSSGPVKYKVVSGDTENETCYTFKTVGMEKNKYFNIKALAGDGITDLEKEISDGGKSLFITIRQINSKNEAIRVINGCFIGNNGILLPYNFPVFTAGTYVVDATVPEDCDFILKLGGIECKDTIPGISGRVFVISEPVLPQQLHLDFIVFRKEPDKAPWGLHALWDCVLNILQSDNKNVVFDRSGAFGYDIKNQEYENVIISPIIGENLFHNVYINGSVTVPEGIVITGNIFATGDVHILGKVIGDIHSEKSVIIEDGAVHEGMVYESS